MELIIQKNCEGIDWEQIPKILELVGMGFHEPSAHRKAFENSSTVIFIFDGSKLVGFGRAISDGAYQAAIYDVAVLPEYQGKGIGKLIVDTLVESLPGFNFILYASPGKEEFYEKLNFRRLKTGMGLFVNEERMIIKGIVE